jgi:hypothetical protein
MRAPLWFAVIFMTGCAVAMSHEARAAEAHAIAGIPRISFTTAGALLVQDLWLGVESDVFAIDVRAPRCARLSGSGDCDAGGPFARVVDRPDASVTLKVPQWQRGAPLVDLTLRSSADNARSDGEPFASGAAFEAEITQSSGRYEWSAGYSQPLAGSAGSRWQAAWIGAAAHVASATTVRLSLERGREITTGARDFQYTLQATRTLDRSLRARAYVSRLVDDPERRWSAGVGLEWRF